MKTLLFLFLTLFSTPHALASSAQGFSNCTESALRSGPWLRTIDAMWVCGETTNSPVIGYGMRQLYVDCISSELARGERDGSRLVMGCKQVSDVTPDPRPNACIHRITPLTPYLRQVDRFWLCGLTTNSPVRGYGDSEIYVSCLQERLQRGIRDGVELTDKCKLDAQRTTSNGPTACTEALQRANPRWFGADRRWLCGETTNSPVRGMGTYPNYVACLLDLVWRGTTDGGVLTGTCGKVVP